MPTTELGVVLTLLLTDIYVTLTIEMSHLMTQILIKYGNIVLTTTTIHSPRCRPSPVSFRPTIVSTSGRLHSEFVRLLFLQTHRETDLFFAASGVHLAQPNSGLFHFLRAAFSAQLKEKVGSTLAKAAALRINLNIDGVPITSRTHTHSSHPVLG